MLFQSVILQLGFEPILIKRTLRDVLMDMGVPGSIMSQGSDNSYTHIYFDSGCASCQVVVVTILQRLSNIPKFQQVANVKEFAHAYLLDVAQRGNQNTRNLHLPITDRSGQ